MTEPSASSVAAPRAGGRGWFSGIVQVLPVVLGYLPVGFAFGVLAQKAGIAVANTVLLSVLVYAGSAQLIAVGLIAAGVPPLSIVATTFIVNLRHLLMSAALTPFLRRWRKSELAAFAFELTDETFAVHSTRFVAAEAGVEPPHSESFAINLTAQASWVFATLMGVIAGQLVTDVEPWALDYALPAMFIGLLVLQLRTWIHALIALVTGLLAIGLLQAGLQQWHVIVATLIGATAGVGVEQWISRRSR